MKQRLDTLLIEKGFFLNRSKAEKEIFLGNVLVNSNKLTKKGTLVDTDAHIEIIKKPRYVSRGGLKLEKAIRVFNINVSNMTIIDVGSSTGGFTDCLLQNRAKRIYAIDAGTNQLNYRLRKDPRVIVREKTNARYLTNNDIPELCDLFVMDCSFISTLKLIPHIFTFIKEKGFGIVLIKPQFEGKREDIKKGGYVKDKKTQKRIIKDYSISLNNLGFSIRALETSPKLPKMKNTEFISIIERGTYKNISTMTYNPCFIKDQKQLQIIIEKISKK